MSWRGQLLDFMKKNIVLGIPFFSWAGLILAPPGTCCGAELGF